MVGSATEKLLECLSKFRAEDGVNNWIQGWVKISKPEKEAESNNSVLNDYNIWAFAFNDWKMEKLKQILLWILIIIWLLKYIHPSRLEWRIGPYKLIWNSFSYDAEYKINGYRCD